MGEVVTGNDFGVTLQPGIFDLRASLVTTTAQPGFDNTLTISYTNAGTEVMSGEVMLSFDPAQTWVGSDEVPSLVAGNVVSWNFTALQVGQTRTIVSTMHTDPAVQMFTWLNPSVVIGPLAGDVFPADNTAYFPSQVLNSFDPNDKTVVPRVVSPDQVANGEWLNYTIRFQNTGSLSAQRVLVIDSLSTDLQWGTLQLLATSHACSMVLLDGGVARFTFDPILLPSVDSNEVASNGFIQFRIKPAPGLTDGSQVQNMGEIYFDYNTAISTPPAILSVDASSSLMESVSATVRIQPNPFTSATRITFPSGKADSELVVRDALGRSVCRVQLAAGSTSAAFDLGDQPCGVYVAELRTAGSVVGTVRLLKQ
jgi:uncharacterized repeat protein (TIGR01451 family)